jgi:hypothetical protein
MAVRQVRHLWVASVSDLLSPAQTLYQPAAMHRELACRWGRWRLAASAPLVAWIAPETMLAALEQQVWAPVLVEGWERAQPWSRPKVAMKAPEARQPLHPQPPQR